VVRALDASGGPADVQRLAGVLLHVGAFDGHLHDLAVVEHDVEVPPHGDRFVVLGDLVVLRHVGVEVVLPGEAAPGCDLGVQGQADADRRLQGRGVEHGK
jgi:hypothetical protein